jgi:hypothetical protein
MRHGMICANHLRHICMCNHCSWILKQEYEISSVNTGHFIGRRFMYHITLEGKSILMMEIIKNEELEIKWGMLKVE